MTEVIVGYETDWTEHDIPFVDWCASIMAQIPVECRGSAELFTDWNGKLGDGSETSCLVRFQRRLTEQEVVEAMIKRTESATLAAGRRAFELELLATLKARYPEAVT